MTMRLWKYGGIAAAMIVCAHIASAETSQVMTWKVDGETRRAIVYPPSASSPGGKAPLVLSFHGHGDNNLNFQHTNMHPRGRRRSSFTSRVCRAAATALLDGRWKKAKTTTVT